MIQTEGNENKKRPEGAPERPLWRLLCVVAHRLRLISRHLRSVIPVFVLAVATAAGEDKGSSDEGDYNNAANGSPGPTW